MEARGLPAQVIAQAHPQTFALVNPQGERLDRIALQPDGDGGIRQPPTRVPILGLFGSHPRHSEGTYSFDQLGQEYLASYSALPPQLGNGWQLFIVTPLRDFTPRSRRTIKGCCISA